MMKFSKLSSLRIAIVAVFLGFAPSAFAQEASVSDDNDAFAETPKQLSDETMDVLFERLAKAEEGEASRIESEITDRWAKSGSLADLYEALRIEPRHFGALIGLGLIMEGLDRDDDAHAAFTAAKKIHPNIDGAEEGIERLRKAVEGQPI